MEELAIINVKESLDSSTEEDDKEDFIINETLAKKGFILINGQPKGCKSFFAMNLAVSLALGEDFCHFKVMKKMKVLYINTEMTPKTSRRRFRKILNGKNARDKDYFIICESLKGRPERNFDKLVEYIDEKYSNQGIDIVVIDPIYKLLDDENDNSLLKIFLDKLEDLRNKHNWTNILVHHKGKNSVNIKDVAFRGCGGTILSRDADTVIDLSVDEDKTNPLKTLKGELSGRFDYRNLDNFKVVLNDGLIELKNKK